MKTNQSSTSQVWMHRIKALGPGLLLASAAVGGSHLVASTQAGALYGWQLAIVVLLVNILKYPFFRFSVHYPMSTNKSLIEGYGEKSIGYVWAFFILSITSATISAGAVALLTATILSLMLPDSFQLSMQVLTILVMLISAAIVVGGHFKVLDKVTKVIMFTLTLATVLVVIVAMAKGSQMKPDFIEPSPWNMASLGFIVALMGWMPSPLEATAANSMWVLVKRRQASEDFTYRNAMFDFNMGYAMSTVLALIFLALGALVHYGNGEAVQMQGGKYVAQLVNMYSATIGDWSRLVVAFIAFACMFGTLLTVVDIYGRTLSESYRILTKKEHINRRDVILGIIWTVISGSVLVIWFGGALGALLKFAMISAFLSAPIFAWLNYSLVQSTEHRIKGGMKWLSIIGLIYLIGFAIIFILDYYKLLT